LEVLMLFKAAPAVLLLLSVACAADRPMVPERHVHGAATLTSGVGGLGPEVLADLAQVRQLAATYHDLSAAVAAGYTAWSPNPFVENATCPSSAEGNMGYHLVNVPLRGGAANPAAGDAVIDQLHPEMLLYEKRADGDVHLVGVEYIVFKAAWERVHGAGAAPPTVFGQPLLYSSHTFPGNPDPIPHYELHVWIFTSNPLGMFHPWNPTVTC
jgi:hypothetical protein